MLLTAACQTIPTPDQQPNTTGSPWLKDESYFTERFTQVSSLDNWTLRAKVGMKTPQQREQASLVWQFVEQRNQARLFGPLGAGAVTLDFDDNGAQLSDRKGVLHRDSSAQALLTRIVGWPIPMQALSYWLFALPQPDAVYVYQLNEAGQLSQLRQLDWLVSYEDYRPQTQSQESVMPMARKLTAIRILPDGENITVKLIAKAWQW